MDNGSNILRINQYKFLQIDIFCEKNKEYYQIWTCSLMDNIVNCPVIKDSENPFFEHPMLRPFEKFLLLGKPDIGIVTHVFILPRNFFRPAILLSIIKTKKRILILPAWGRGISKNIKKIQKPPIAHMTIEENKKNVYKLHFTGQINKKDKKMKNYAEIKLNTRNVFSTHIGTLGVNDLTNLDPLGIVFINIDRKKFPRKDLKIEEIENKLNASLSDKHPLFNLPPEFNWDENHHLEVSLAIIGNRLENVEYIKKEFVKSKKGSIEQLNKIPLDNEKSLLITLSMPKGKLAKSFQWFPLKLL